MAYSAAADRSNEIKTIFIRPGDDLVADDFNYGATDLGIYPGMCVDLVNSAKFSSGHATNKGGYYTPQITNFNYYEGKTVLDAWDVSSIVMTRLPSPGALIAVRVGAGTTTNYAKGAELVNQAHVDSADSTGLTFKSGTLVAGTVCRLIVEEAPAADITTTGLILARVIPSKDLSDLA